MDKLLDEIESYWSTRTEGYSEVNEKELNGMQKKAWLETRNADFGEKGLGKMRIQKTILWKKKFSKKNSPKNNIQTNIRTT